MVGLASSAKPLAPQLEPKYASQVNLKRPEVEIDLNQQMNDMFIKPVEQGVPVWL